MSTPWGTAAAIDSPGTLGSVFAANSDAQLAPMKVSLPTCSILRHHLLQDALMPQAVDAVESTVVKLQGNAGFRVRSDGEGTVVVHKLLHGHRARHAQPRREGLTLASMSASSSLTGTVSPFSSATGGKLRARNA